MDYLFSLEPSGLINHFLTESPEGFVPIVSSLGQPGFYMDFNLMTTADRQIIALFTKIPIAGYFLRRLLTWRTLFFGTTVTEYAPLTTDTPPAVSIASMLATWRGSSRMMILKDLPKESPLISKNERDTVDAIVEECEKLGFLMLAGQALAYVPIDFESESDYLSRLSSGRRKDIKRKLRARSKLRIEVIETGCERLKDSDFIGELYELYAEVYAQSEIHFDKLTVEFFAAVLQDDLLNGYLFLYSSDETLIGFNLCFIHRDMLVDKYVGFRYPAARDHNLYYVSWMENLAFARSHHLSHYVAGWTDPEIKAYLGAKFTLTQHAVYLRNPLLRRILGKLTKHFENDRAWFEGHKQ